jgi:hypothetical protein
MKQCGHYDADGDAWDKPCGYSNDTKCRYFNPKCYCPSFNQMKEKRDNTLIRKILRFVRITH